MRRGLKKFHELSPTLPLAKLTFEHSSLCTLQATAPTGHDGYTDEMAGKQMQSSRGVGADWLISDKDIADLTKALAAGDIEAAAQAIGVAAKTRGMSKISRQTGLSRESLYKTLSGESDPRFKTIARVLSALGLQLRVERAEHRQS